ncbi:MAG: hypothetical protein ABEJ62_01020 [Candidatus Nanohaloarchaea archaeon]
MICVISLIVFGILGIFSASHRETALEAWECVKSTLRNEPCDTGLDDRMKASVVGRALDLHPSLGRFVNRYFRVLSWILLILLVVSGLLAAQGAYNWAVYGNCNGPNAEEGCTLNALAGVGEVGGNETPVVENGTGGDEGAKGGLPGPG